jgi:hypothetical protein
MTCLYCRRGDIPVEIFGFVVHKLPDRWISCCAKNANTPFEHGVIATRQKNVVPSILPEKIGSSESRSSMSWTPSE